MAAVHAGIAQRAGIAQLAKLQRLRALHVHVQLDRDAGEAPSAATIFSPRPDNFSTHA